jgi:hypothetical protein
LALKWYRDGELELRFVNPPLFTYTLTAAYWLWITLNPIAHTRAWASQAVFFARLWSVFFGVLTVALAYTLARRVYNGAAGLAAMVLLAGLFLPARESHFAVNDVLATFLVLLAIYLGIILLRQRRWSNYVAAGGTVGLAMAAKLTGGLVALALVVAHFLGYPMLKIKSHIRLFAGLTIALITFVALSNHIFRIPNLFILDIIKHLQYGTEGYGGLRMTPGTGWGYYIQVLGWGMGWLLLLVVVVAVVAAVKRRNKSGVVLAVFPLTLLAYMGAQKIVFARFILPGVPPLVILAAVELAVWRERSAFWRRWPVPVWSVVISALLFQPLAKLIWFDHLLTMPDTRKLASEWMVNQFPEKTVIAKERFSVFNSSYFDEAKWPYVILNMDGFDQTRETLDYYMARKADIVVLSSFSFNQARQDPNEEESRLKQLSLLEEDGTLLKSFNPYIASDDGWFYHDQVYGPAGETLRRIRPGPLIKVYRLPDASHYYKVDDLDITIPLEANFADQIQLLGYDLPKTQVKTGEAIPVTLYWQAPPDKAPDADFIQFNHLHDIDGTLRGGYDRQPLEYYNTRRWAPGEIVIDGYAVPVDADAPPGEYYLDVGYYLTVGESPVSLPLVVDGRQSEITAVTIGPIEVVAP